MAAIQSKVTYQTPRINVNGKLTSPIKSSN